MKLALTLLVWTLIALGALYVLGPDPDRVLPKPKPPPSQPTEHAAVISGDVLLYDPSAQKRLAVI